MNYSIDPTRQENVSKARNSFSGVLLTDAQFDEFVAVVAILEREIRTTGTFKDKLDGYAHAIARSQRMDDAKANTISRDLFKEITGQTLNQMRAELMQNEKDKEASPEYRQDAYEAACEIGPMVETGEKMTSHRAYAFQADFVAAQHGVTAAGAKRIMAEEFEGAENRTLYDWGKELDDKYYRPQIEAAKKEREARRAQERGTGARGRTNSRSHAPSGPSMG